MDKGYINLKYKKEKNLKSQYENMLSLIKYSGKYKLK